MRFGGSWPVSEACPAWFGGSRGPGKLKHPDIPWFLGRLRGATGGREGGNSQATEGWRSRWICGFVYKGIYMIVGQKSKLYASQQQQQQQQERQQKEQQS
jgi:hypothetical protein